MRWVRAWAIALALVSALLPIVPLPTFAAQHTLDVVISMLRAEPAPLVTPGDSRDQSLFVLVHVQYRDVGLLHLIPKNFRVVDEAGVTYAPQTFSGLDALRDEEIVSGGNAGGWLLFTVPKAVRSVSLMYLLYLTGKADPHSFVTTAPFAVRASAVWSYGLATQPALKAYLADEALAAGYVRMTVDPGAPSADAISGLDRSLLSQSLRALGADRRAFDGIAPTDATSRALRIHVDQAFGAVEADLSALVATHPPTRWSDWWSRFVHDDRALADLYQTWPASI